MGETGRSTSPPPDRQVPHPPTAAPAAGGLGSPDLRCVNSVGSVWVLAGGVGEWAARPEWRFAMEVFLSGGGGLRSSAADLPSSACSGLDGAAGCVNPSPESAGRRIRVVEDLQGAGGAEQGAGYGGVGWRSSGAELRRLPVRRGATPNPRRVRSSGGGAPAIRLRLRFRQWSPEGPFCNFALSLDFSVRSLL